MRNPCSTRGCAKSSIASSDQLNWTSLPKKGLTMLVLGGGKTAAVAMITVAMNERHLVIIVHGCAMDGDTS